MANKILTFVDASVLIYAANKPTSTTLGRRLRALQILGDPDRQFIASEFLRLEVIPIASYYQKIKEINFYQRYFDGVSLWAFGIFGYAGIRPRLSIWTRRSRRIAYRGRSRLWRGVCLSRKTHEAALSGLR